jgi:pimeloyl-ACP methyl ester carboxylesterase
MIPSMHDLVFIHGGLYNSTCWDAVVAVLGERDPRPFGRTLQLDIPGAGTKRERPRNEPTVAGVIDELSAEIHAASLRSPVLIGHSIAGALLPSIARQVELSALCFLSTAILAPGQIGNDLFGSTSFGEDPDHVGYPADPRTTSQRQMDRIRFCLDFTDEQSEQWLDHCYEDTPFESLMATPAAAIDESTLPPVTYVRTLRSPVFPLEWQDRFASRIGRNVRIVDLDTGHAPFFTHPGEVAALIVDLYGEPAPPPT